MLGRISLSGHRRGQGEALWIVAAPGFGHREEVGHDLLRCFRSAVHLDVKLGSVNRAVIHTEALGFRLCAGAGGGDQAPAVRWPLDLSAMAFHYVKLAWQILEDGIVRHRTHLMRPALEDAAGGITARAPRRL